MRCVTRAAAFEGNAAVVVAQLIVRMALETPDAATREFKGRWRI
jgi:hypothetical protein